MSVAAARQTKPNTDPVRVMVVDDAVVARGLMARWINEAPDLAVVGTIRTGKLAVEQIAALEPDVVVLDIEMPEMDGLTALPLLLRERPGVQIVMASTLTRRNAEISLKALSLGAADYLPKPDSNSGVSTSPEFRRDLVAKVQALGARGKVTARRNGTPKSGLRVAPSAGASDLVSKAEVSLPNMRRWSSAVPRVLAIGSSTGGPQALAKLMETVGSVANRVPIVITQHMPATFTAILAENLGKASGLPSAEGRDGEPLKAGHIYVAPGGRHMVVKRGASGPEIALQDGPQINFCKPAVDPLFESLSEVYGSAVLAAVLTGMGHDGGDGAVKIADAGGSVIAQDEQTSVVWGMPQAVVQKKACCAVLPLDQLAQKVASLIKGAN